MPINLFQQLNGNYRNQQNTVNSGNQFTDLVNRFTQFRNSFQGDPQQIVQSMLQSGRMSQQQFQQLGQMADEFIKLLPK